MPELIPFFYNNQPVRTLQHDDGTTWWVASDVCAALKLSNVTRTCERLAQDEKGFTQIHTPGGEQSGLIVSEAGLYRIIMRSDKPEARIFQHWVFHDVLPQIRKTGSYSPQPDVLLSRYPELRAITDLVIATAQARDLAEAAQLAATRAEDKADRALETQAFYTVAEYLKFEKNTTKVPESAYRALSDHLQLYCMNNRIPFRRIAVDGRRGPEEHYAFHVSVWSDVFPGWLTRRYAQADLNLVRKVEER